VKLVRYVSVAAFGLSVLAFSNISWADIVTVSHTPTPVTTTTTTSLPPVSSTTTTALPSAPVDSGKIIGKSGEKKVCDINFPSRMQESARTACQAGATSFAKSGSPDVAHAAAVNQCASDYRDDSRLKNLCNIGVWSQQDRSENKNTYRDLLKLCQDYYPAQSEIDFYLQESCLIGAYLSRMPSIKTNSLLACRTVSTERAFLGPCGAGLSLAVDAKRLNDSHGDTSALGEQNKTCLKYFDSKVFHTGYRACLNARELSLHWTGRLRDVLHDCGEIVSDNTGDTERAACMIGASIYHGLSQNLGKAADAKHDANPRFAKCGESKVTYQEGEFLSCLTAASLLDFGDHGQAQHACKEIFHSKKSKNRGHCSNSLGLF
jgi:hypothetical protein